MCHSWNTASRVQDSRIVQRRRATAVRQSAFVVVVVTRMVPVPFGKATIMNTIQEKQTENVLMGNPAISTGQRSTTARMD